MGLKPLLKAEQFDRYQRHLNLPEFGVDGQRKLLEGSVLLVGAGGLGCPSALYLAAAGVGRIGLIDDDVVDLSNLQRQILYGTPDVGRLKVEVAKERVAHLNPEVNLEIHATRLTSDNALDLLRDYDVIVDGTDNFSTRYLTNDACSLLGKPCVYGAILRFEGQVSVFDAQRGPCYRCLFPEPPPAGSIPSCAEGGVLGVLPGVVAILQATEAVKLLAKIGEPLLGRFIQYDALDMRFSEFRFSKDPLCPICGKNPTLSALSNYDEFCGVSQRLSMDIQGISGVALNEMRVHGVEHLLLDVRDLDEVDKAKIGGAVLLPLSQLESRFSEIDDWKERLVVVHCHKGSRSEKACQLLALQGFSNVRNLEGGIDAWALTVDSDVARYD